MNSEPYPSISYNPQLHGQIHASDVLSQRRPYASEDSGLTSSRPAGSPPLFSSNSYMIPLRRSPERYESAQGAYPGTVYPDSSQLTATALASALGPNGRTTTNFDRPSTFSNANYEAPFDYDAPHLGDATASANGSHFDRYGVSALRHTSARDHRPPSSLPALLTRYIDGASSQSTSSTTGPFYSPSPSQTLTSYPGESASSNTSPASMFRKPTHVQKLVAGSGFDSSLGNMDYDVFLRTGVQQPAKPPPRLTPSIPMSKASVDWSAITHQADSYSSASPSSSTTPTLSALPSATTKPIGLSQPYRTGDRRSSSLTPPSDSVRADLGPRSEVRAKLRDRPPGAGGKGVVQAPAPSLKRSSTQESAAAGPERQQQQPVKKKKKSKMHACEVCSKKFPRPSGLRTHMNTHNNARPYACGFPGCTRTFGVRSNAKRHLRTHGIIPAPSVPSQSSADAPYVVGFSPPVIAPAREPSESSLGDAPADGGSGSASHCGSLEDGGSSGVGDGGSSKQPKHRLTRAPFYKLRWMPPSLTSRTNAANLRPVDEATGEVSDDDMDSEEGDDPSDRDESDPGGGGGGGNYDEDYDEDRKPFGYEDKGMGFLPTLSNISLPMLVSSNRSSVSSSSGSTTSHHHQQQQQHHPLALYPMVMSPATSSTAPQSCVCPFSSCFSIPCRSLSGGSSTSSSLYSSLAPSPQPNIDESLTMGGYAVRSTSDLSMGMSGMSSLGMSSMGMGGSVNGGMGYSNLSHSTGSAGMYGVGVGGVNAAHYQHHHLLASA